MSSNLIYIVKFSGPFGYIKPWTAVRDELTYSQPFLTPSIIEGMRQKLEVNEILRHRLKHHGLSIQQERTQSPGWKTGRTHMSRSLSILSRGVMLQPELTLAFNTSQEAELAAEQHICLCRNEDVLLPLDVKEITINDFERIPGVELKFGISEDAFLVGYNRFQEASPMYGHMIIVNEEGV